MGQKKRIGLFIPSLVGGGAERVMLNLACGLADMGHAVDMVLVRAEGPYLAQIPSNVRVVNLKTRKTGASLPALARYLKQEKPHSMLSALNEANVALLWARRVAGTPTRVVISIHNTLSQEFRSGGLMQRKVTPWCITRFGPWADGIVAVSNGVADDFAQVTGLPRKRIEVIYNPVISEELLLKSRQPVNHPWLIPGQPPVILSVGRLNPQKNYGHLLSAFAQVRDRQNARLLILGDGEDRKKLEAQVLALGLRDDVSLPGFTDNPFAYMSHARLFALSSSWEGLPTVLIEALACGCPIVSTDCQSGPAEILAGGKWGRLTPVGDVDAMALALEASLSEPRQTPPPESWEPYQIQVAAAAYAKILLCGAE